MNICDKHRDKIFVVDKDASEQQVVSEYMDKMNIIECQDDIDKKHNKCMVCHFGAIGRQTLEEIAEMQKKAKAVC